MGSSEVCGSPSPCCSTWPAVGRELRSTSGAYDFQASPTPVFNVPGERLDQLLVLSSLRLPSSFNMASCWTSSESCGSPYPTAVVQHGQLLHERLDPVPGTVAVLRSPCCSTRPAVGRVPSPVAPPTLPLLFNTASCWTRGWTQFRGLWLPLPCPCCLTRPAVGREVGPSSGDCGSPSPAPVV